SLPDSRLYTVVAPQLEDESNFLGSAHAYAVEFYYPDSYVNSAAQRWPNDIAIIKLEASVGAADFRYLLNDSTNNAYPIDGEYMAVGHGAIASDDSGGSQLLETRLQWVNTAVCQQVFGNNVSTSQICFDGEQVTTDGETLKNATCFGDSGGPVYWYHGGQYIQIGITSFGPGVCGDPTIGVTSVFTEIYDYQGWINRVISGLEQPKIYVTSKDGQRTLVVNDSNSGSDGSASPPPSDGGGGSVGLFSGLLLAMLGWQRRRRIIPHQH
ncbi:trypsin-like serine protease, partial [Vibrio sp.]|uniref:trypsin-like serine protease n=1 Tax=Vibrio sp. TaxID=678 RepID=UPI003D12BC10